MGILRTTISLLFSFVLLRAEYYEGLPSYENADLNTLNVFLPYNPIVIEAGALYGNSVNCAARIWPKGRIIAFEPNPHAFEILQKNVDARVELYPFALHFYNGTATLHVSHGMYGVDPSFEYASSLLPLTPDMRVYSQGPDIQVPCVVLEEWCNEHNIDHIDLLKLDVTGMEMGVLYSSPHILKNTKIVYVRTLIHPYRLGMTQYNELKDFLQREGFVLLSHRYNPGIDGEAIFLCRELFDAFFKLCLGIHLGV